LRAVPRCRKVLGSGDLSRQFIKGAQGCFVHVASLANRGEHLRNLRPKHRAGAQPVTGRFQRAYSESNSMVSLDQMTKLQELLDQGWRTASRTTTIADMKLGGPALLRKGDKYVMVYANGELIEPTPEEIAKW
jgi:hypothetical protein